MAGVTGNCSLRDVRGGNPGVCGEAVMEAFRAAEGHTRKNWRHCGIKSVWKCVLKVAFVPVAEAAIFNPMMSIYWRFVVDRAERGGTNSVGLL